MATSTTATSTTINPALAAFDVMPDSAHVRIDVVSGWRGVSRATVWRWVKAGYLPAPVKIGPNSTAWRVGDLRKVAAAQA